MYLCINNSRHDNVVLFNFIVVYSWMFGKGGGDTVILDFGTVLFIYFV